MSRGKDNDLRQWEGSQIHENFVPIAGEVKEEGDWQHKILLYKEGRLVGEGTYGKVHR